VPHPLAHYELQEWLGSGATGSVYRARDTRNGAAVAVKIIRPEVARHPDVIARLQLAARIGSQLYHPNIARIIESGEARGEFYVASELVEGESLRARLQREGQLSEAETYRIALSVAHALNAADAHRVVHRNLTPENILLGDGAKVCVSDFGIAAAQDVVASSRIAFVPAPDYAAPEVFERPMYLPSDSYSLGVIMFEMLTGSLPFKQTTASHRSLDGALLRRASPQLAPIIQRLLQPAAEHRYHDPDDLIQALHGVGRLRTTFVSGDQRRRPRARAGVAAAGATIALLGKGITVAGGNVRSFPRRVGGISNMARALLGGVSAGVASAAAPAGRVAGGACRWSAAGISAFVQRARGMSRNAIIIVAGVIGVAVVGGSAVVAFVAIDGRGGGDGASAVGDGGAPGAPTSSGVIAPPTSSPRARTSTSTAVPPAPDPPQVVVAAEAVAPSPTRRAAQVRSGTIRQDSPAAPADPPEAPTRPPAATATLAPPAPAAPTATFTPRSTGGSDGGGGSGSVPMPPPSTPTRTPTPVPPTATPAPQVINLASPGGWDVYADAGLDDRIGSARTVCLRREPSAVPANCPDSATSWDAAGNIWNATIPAAQWMWAPGITKDDWNDGDQFYFAQCFNVARVPVTGTLEIAGDHGANVYVNDNWLRWTAGSNNVITIDIGPWLESGENCIKLWAANGNQCGDCPYEDNPAGLLVRVRIVVPAT
jgi:hypothetical protein